VSTHEPLLDLLEARDGIVCAVGAGGKKSVLQQLAARHPGRAALTATVAITHFPPGLGLEIVIDGDEQLPARVAAIRPAVGVAYACPSDKPGRHAGVAGHVIERIHREQGFAATYVKADGARMRWIKAPAGNEPVLPPGCTGIVAVVSARAIGEPLDERVAHRIDHVGRVTGLKAGERIAPVHVGRLIADPDGLYRSAPGRRFVPLINMVDDDEREKFGREAAEAALALNPALERVVLCCLRRPDDPVVAVVRR
jgi:probable selenium-dependent hydroxylase accessory protein YqeC